MSRVAHFEIHAVLDVEGLLECNEDVRKEDWSHRRGDADDPGRGQPVDTFCVISNTPGNGDFYAVCLAPVETFQPGGVIHWAHETNRRSPVAHDLRGYIAGGNTGVR